LVYSSEALAQYDDFDQGFGRAFPRIGLLMLILSIESLPVLEKDFEMSLLGEIETFYFHMAAAGFVCDFCCVMVPQDFAYDLVSRGGHHELEACADHFDLASIWIWVAVLA
jgi:hypothetical protein